MFKAVSCPSNKTPDQFVDLLNDMEAKGWEYVTTFAPHATKPRILCCLFKGEGVAPEKPKTTLILAPSVAKAPAKEEKPDAPTLPEAEAPKAEEAPKKVTSAKSAPGKRKTRKAKK